MEVVCEVRLEGIGTRQLKMASGRGGEGLLGWALGEAAVERTAHLS